VREILVLVMQFVDLVHSRKRHSQLATLKLLLHFAENPLRSSNRAIAYAESRVKGRY
jgi:hypothetical protein